MLIPKSRLPIRDIILFGFLPNFLKKIVYRLKGYKIGKKVTIGFGSVVCGEEVLIGDYTNIGFLTVLRGKKITIGSHVNIGATTIIDTPYIEIGDGSKINEQVFVGGMQFPDSKFVLGKNCQIMQMSFINPTRSIIVGDDTGIGGHCLVFGHSSWLSHFEGYPVEFKPIEIGNSVSLAWNVFVLPGTKIGDGAVISANSLVHRTIPPRCLAAGFPARVISKYPDFPKEVSEEQKKEILEKIANEVVTFFNDSGLSCEMKDNVVEVFVPKRNIFKRKERAWRMKIEYNDPLQAEEIPSENMSIDVFLSLKNIPKEIRQRLNDKKIMWIDIERKEQSAFWNDLGEEVTLYLKRYGVRLFRVDSGQ